MKKLVVLFVFGFFCFSCKQKSNTTSNKNKNDVVAYDQAPELKEQQTHENPRMKFKLLKSKYLDFPSVFEPFANDLLQFTEEDYTKLKPLILEQDIPSIQKNILDKKLTYEKLTLFYLYRIQKYESDNTLFLNAIIALNPNVLEEARNRDQQGTTDMSSIFGMPILLKDNINTKGMATTAGAAILKDNYTKKDAFVVERLKEAGAIILGKVNLSEWAYFFCEGCPLGYSAIGGQTLNPYGRKVFETGGSSSGSGVAVAANYAVAAIGTETSGSITSPSSMNSVVGLKPTIGRLSRSGIVPISSTLDTPGPMTKSVIDNAILLEALVGLDTNDAAQVSANLPLGKFRDFDKGVDFLKDKRLGVLTSLLQDSIYKHTIQKIQDTGAKTVDLTPKQMNYDGFLTLLTADMKHDFPIYFNALDSELKAVNSVEKVVEFNKKDSLKRAPYGQQLFEGIVSDTTSDKDLIKVKENLNNEGRKYLSALTNDEVDVILSINNTHSGVAAVAKYPTITVPMGYKPTGEPISLTFISSPNSEKKLLAFAYAFEQLTKVRKIPKNYP